TFRWHERRAPLVVIETDAGLTGVGEAWSPQPRIALVLDDLADRCAPALLGRDPLAHASIVAELEARTASSDPWVTAAAGCAIGDDVVLWVDAVNQLTRGTAPAWCRSLAQAGVVAIQAPLPFEDIAGMAEINASLLPVIATEAEYREETFSALLDAAAVTYL